MATTAPLPSPGRTTSLATTASEQVGPEGNGWDGDDELEQERLEAITQRDEEAADPHSREAGRAGTPGCHEALHMAHVLAGLVDRELLNHPAALLDPNWYARARRACAEFADLYQVIGAEHLEKLPALPCLEGRPS